MRLKLWKHGLWSLLLIILISAIVIFYAASHISTISQRVTIIEAADDLRLALLELRRYEKNLLLFREEAHAEGFHEQLLLLDKRIHDSESEFVRQMGARYTALLTHMAAYKKDSGVLLESLAAERGLLEKIRALGRAIELDAGMKARAFELRRHEKNYFIYREENDIERLRRTAAALAETAPALRSPLASYQAAFAALLQTEGLKKEATESMRRAAREMEKEIAAFSERERAAIEGVVSISRKLFITAFIFLVLSVYFMATHFSLHILNVLKRIERSFNRLKSGDFSRTITIDHGSVPEEIASFVAAYNTTVTRLGSSKAELEATLTRLEAVNRELVERQDELVEAERTTAMRLLASEIVHEVNNPLSSITMMLGMLHEELPAEDPRKESIGFILKEIGRCTLVLNRLTDFARSGPLRTKETNTAALVTEAIESASRQHNSHAVTITAVLEGLPEALSVDPVLMHQVLVNIIANALHATPPGGAVRVDGATGNGSIIITVEDTGGGISQEDLAHIFEPFYTTKAERGGTGLGLALAKKIVEKHRGRIEIESVEGAGTLVKILLPREGTAHGEDTRN